MNRIPGKMVHRFGSKAELQRLLSPREIGYCTDDEIAYIKTNGRLEPLAKGEARGLKIAPPSQSGEGTMMFYIGELL